MAETAQWEQFTLISINLQVLKRNVFEVKLQKTFFMEKLVVTKLMMATRRRKTFVIAVFSLTLMLCLLCYVMLFTSSSSSRKSVVVYSELKTESTVIKKYIETFEPHTHFSDVATLKTAPKLPPAIDNRVIHNKVSFNKLSLVCVYLYQWTTSSVYLAFRGQVTSSLL